MRILLVALALTGVGVVAFATSGAAGPMFIAPYVEIGRAHV